MTGLLTVFDFFFFFMWLNACIQICLVCMQFLELFNVKYFGMISNGETKHKSNHRKTNLSVDLHLKWLLLGNWQEKDTFSCITKALLISVLWVYCGDFWLWTGGKIGCLLDNRVRFTGSNMSSFFLRWTWSVCFLSESCIPVEIQKNLQKTFIGITCVPCYIFFTGDAPLETEYYTWEWWITLTSP